MVGYDIVKINETLQLINNDYLPYITGMYMNNLEISIVSSYDFPSINYYEIYFYMNVSSIHSLSHMFARIKGIDSIYFTRKFDTKNINNMDFMFYNCSVMSLDVSIFNTSKVTSMNGTFAHSSIRRINIQDFDTSRVTNMDQMFTSCVYLDSLDVSNFNTKSVISMNYMFQNLTR